ncbi:MAG: hypothetical protein GY930_06485 [bacterium]|nr:hypothetical protein [bacterium]
MTTNAQGEYRVEGLADRDWGLRAYLEGFEVKADSSARRVSIGMQVDFTAHAIHLLQVAVLKPDGSDAEHALLSVRRLGRSQGSKSYKWSSDQAALRLSPGRYGVRAHSQSPASMELEELASEIQNVVVEEGKEPEVLRLILAPRLGIRGSVRAKGVSLASDSPVVLWQTMQPGHEVDLNALAGSDNEKWVELGDDFVLNDLAEGRYVIGVARSWTTPVVDHKVVDVNQGFAEVVLELPEIDRSKMISVTVLDPDGRTLLDVGFSIQTKRKNSSSPRGLQVGRSKSGEYLIDLPAPFHTNYFEPQGEGMDFWLVASFSEYGALEAELDRGQTQLTMRYSAPASLVVSAPGCAGSDYEGRLRIYLAKKVGADRRDRLAPGRGDKLSGEYAWEWSGLSPGPTPLRCN